MIQLAPTKAHALSRPGRRHAVALVIAKALGKGPDAPVVGGLLGVAAHAAFDAPVAQLMAANGIQF